MSQTSLDTEIDLLRNIAADGYGDGYKSYIGNAINYSVQLIVSNPSTPSGCTVALSSSNDGVNWVALTPVNVTVATTSFMTIPTNFAKYIRATKALSSGSVETKVLLVARAQM